MVVGNGNPTANENPTANGKTPADFQVRRYHVDLDSRSVTGELAPCVDVEDVFGGISRCSLRKE